VCRKEAEVKVIPATESLVPKARETTTMSITHDPRIPPNAPDAVQPLRARLSADLLTAMKGRDKPVIDTLRCLLAVLDNAGAQDPKRFASSTEVPRKALTQSELEALLQIEIESRGAAVIEYERGGRHHDAARLRAELALLARYISP
jgi:uncharacterized protein YqeY